MSQFTKKAIIEAFVTLLNKHPLDKITIKDIVDECGVTRSTFYYYFADIFALLEELFKIETQKTLEQAKDYTSFIEGFNKSISFALENKKAIYHVYNSLSREHLEHYLYNVIDDMIITIVKSQIIDLNVSEEDISIVTDIYKYAIIGFLLKWLQNG